ncbi:hypothetical protein, partial [Prevotella illustrans]|uniref:hypothetical protein n=1 Tax=Prevotella illustrans TaxID=2800387 RepID=UPI001A9E466F
LFQNNATFLMVYVKIIQGAVDMKKPCHGKFITFLRVSVPAHRKISVCLSVSKKIMTFVK